ncbi:MAG: hypothetical protein WCF84_08755 [Anaerolineae bacterium]
MSRLYALCEKLIEASWLAAIIMAPLFFNVYSSRVFEPDKISLVRTLALVMIAAWLVIRAEKFRQARSSPSPVETAPRPWAIWLRGVPEKWSRSNPLVLPTLALVVAYIISTIASVSPSISFLGSYTRMQGLYSTFSYIVIFLLAASTMHTRTQLDRAINVALITSFPVAFYGLIQHYFLDPLPWGGDVNTRVASNMGNSIFVGAYLIMVIPLALGRLVEQTGRASAQFSRTWARGLLYGAAVASVLLLAAAWGLLFEFGAKKVIEAQIQDRLTPEQLAAASSNFTTALVISVAVVLVWWVAGFLLNKRVAAFLLTAIYSLLLAVQGLTLLFTQSRGPLLGMMAGLFAFALLYALVRGARRLALGVMGSASVLVLLLIGFNMTAGTALAGLRDIPYIGRLGQVFDTEGGTGLVRVLIWQGALPLVLPHAPLWSPASGIDVLNPVRPLIGYGPEAMYVAYSSFYPPALAHIESRNATPDRSHNETFDALVTTGLLGFLAENILFLSIFYFGLKWLGLVNTPRERNVLIALWYAGGIIGTLAAGLTLGWQFLGLGLPAGMLGGLFIYLVVFALFRSNEVRHNQDPLRALVLIACLAAIVAHFTEIHLGIAIVSTRTYFWFLAALLVFAGTRLVDETAPALERATSAPDETDAQPVMDAETLPNSSVGRARRRKGRRSTGEEGTGRQANPGLVNRTTPAMGPAPRIISTTPLLAHAFIGGLILATMGFDYITSSSIGAITGRTPNAFDIIITALTSKATTAGFAPSYALLWLFLGTFVVMLAIALTEWGWNIALPTGEWVTAAVLFSVLALAILASFLLYHTMLISTVGSGTFDALFASVTLFVVFMVVMAVVIAITLLMDERPGTFWVARPANWIVAPALVLVVAILIGSTNINTVQADMIYKQAASMTSPENLPNGIALFKRALALEPTQDFYWLFLGRSYLQLSQSTNNITTRQQALKDAESALLSARQFNPLNTDHSANLARLHQSWAALASSPSEQDAQYQKAFEYYQAAIRLSPNTAHLYDQFAQAELDYLKQAQLTLSAETVAQYRRSVADMLDRSYKLDSDFCLTFAVRSVTQDKWDAATSDALAALKLSSSCEPFGAEGRSLAMQTLATAGDQAVAAGQGAQFASALEEFVSAMPSVELYTSLVNYYSKTGQIGPSIAEVDAALALIPSTDAATRKQYQDFRGSLVSLQQLISTTLTSPNDAEAQRKLADSWLARGQPDLALAPYQKVAVLLPNDYESHRRVTLLLLRQNQWSEAASVLATTTSLSPAADRAFWEQLGQALDSAQKGQKDAALVSVQNLLKTAQAKDSLAQDALRALSAKLQS